MLADGRFASVRVISCILQNCTTDAEREPSQIIEYIARCRERLRPRARGVPRRVTRHEYMTDYDGHGGGGNGGGVRFVGPLLSEWKPENSFVASPPPSLPPSQFPI